MDMVDQAHTVMSTSAIKRDEDDQELLNQQREQEQEQGQGNVQQVPVPAGNATVKRRIREREKEKERTKLRERQRRAITSRILSGLRQYGNYTLPARADINDVIAALAREAGWTVDSDGTTYRSQAHTPYPVKVAALSSTSLAGSPGSSASLRSTLVKNPIDHRPSGVRLREGFTLKSPGSTMLGEKGPKKEKIYNVTIDNSLELMEVQEFLPKEPERDFSGTPDVPVYVMLPLGIINDRCQLVDPEGLRKDLRALKSINVDGIMVDCWWGVVEGRTPQKYVWSGYRELFNIVREAKLKLQTPYPVKVAALSSTSLAGSPGSSASLRSTLVKNPIDHRPSGVRLREGFTLKSPGSTMLGEKGPKKEKIYNVTIDNSLELMEVEQVQEFLPKEPERDFSGTPDVPVYVMLPLGIINDRCQLVDPEGLRKDLRALKSINVDGIMVDCWWGVVEGRTPQKYVWSGYRELFNIVREAKLKLQVVMSFHECGGTAGDDVNIPLPKWILEVGKDNPDIFFTDREGRRNTECLTWGIDKERVLKGRTAVEVYFDYMRSFRMEFDDLFVDGAISEIEIGLGASGELKYPSYPERHGWRYPGIGEFQCYDKYMQKSLRKAAEARGHSFWARGPDNVGYYNSQPHDTGFFRDGGDYNSYYGRFFLRWYSQGLIEHGNRVLGLANLAFEGTRIAVKVSGIHWWYKTASHAAELTAGFYNSSNLDGYGPICQIVKKHNATFNFSCVDLNNLDQEQGFLEAMEDPHGLVWQVMNAAWDAGIPVASVNPVPCYDRDGYNRILENAKPRNDPDGRHLIAFTYLRLSPTLMERANFCEFDRFVKRMHGEAVLNLHV